jgi:hypothetical protein
MSFRDIGVILNKAAEEKRTEGIKQQDNTEENRGQEQQHLSLASQAYKLFSDRKTPLEIAIALNLRESGATKFYKEYWKLKQLHNLNMVYEEVKDDIESFLKLHRLSKAAGMSARHVINLLEIANTNLPAIQCRYKRLKREVSTLEFNKQQSHKVMTYFNNQIETKSKALTSYHISCIRERREIENLYNEKTRLEDIVTGFKSNNEEYLDKIKHAAYEEVKRVLTDSKLPLKFATLSVIESLRRNPELYSFVIYDNTTISYGSNYPSLMSREQQQQSFNDSYTTTLILEEAEKLYNTLKTELTNSVMRELAADLRA